MEKLQGRLIRSSAVPRPAAFLLACALLPIGLSCRRRAEKQAPPAATDGRDVSPGQTQRPASQRRLSLQSLSDAHGVASTWAHPAPISRGMAAATRRVTHRPPCVEPVNTEPGTRGARTARGAGRARPATDIEFGWRKVKANWKSCKLV